jgi:hypothetical protein
VLELDDQDNIGFDTNKTRHTVYSYLKDGSPDLVPSHCGGRRNHPNLHESGDAAPRSIKGRRFSRIDRAMTPEYRPSSLAAILTAQHLGDRCRTS